MTYRFEQLSKAQQNYARRLSTKTANITVSQCAKYLDDFAAWDRGEIGDATLQARTGHQVVRAS